MTSAIYNGTVIHKRFKPKLHFFKYKVFSLLIDLSDLNILNKNISFFSYNRFNLISFFDKDHGDRDGKSLIECLIFDCYGKFSNTMVGNFFSIPNERMNWNRYDFLIDRFYQKAYPDIATSVMECGCICVDRLRQMCND